MTRVVFALICGLAVLCGQAAAQPWRPGHAPGFRPGITAAPSVGNHYLSVPGTSGQGATTPNATSRFPTDGFFDVRVSLNLTSYAPASAAELVGNNVYGTAYGFAFILNSNQTLTADFGTSAGHQASATSPAISTLNLGGADVVLGALCNVATTANATNGFAGSNCQFRYSLNYGATWSNFGSAVTLSNPGTYVPDPGNTHVIQMAVSPLAGKFYGAALYTSAGAVLFNPDYTAGATSPFRDTSPTQNPWTIVSPATEN